MRGQVRTLLTGFVAPARMRSATARALLAWLLAAAVVLGAGSWLVLAHADAARRAVLGFLLPSDWVDVAEVLVESFFGPELRRAAISLAVGGAFVLVAVLLFPLKERASAAFERESGATNGRAPAEYPLWFQALEEARLVIVYLALSLAVFWVGYEPVPWRRTLATWLGHLVLAITIALDYIAPTLQRHRVSYARTARVLLRNPVLALGFGAVCALPPAMAARMVAAPGEDAVTAAVCLLVLVQLGALCAAVLVGTWVGGRLLDEAEATPPIPVGIRAAGWIAVVAFLTVNGLVFERVGRAVWAVTPVAKCDWSLAPDTFELEAPSLTERTARLRLRVTVHNPTGRDARVEENRLEVHHAGERIATTTLPRFRVPAGATVEQHLELAARIDGALLRKGTRLLFSAARGEAWDTFKAAGADAIDGGLYAVTLFLDTAIGEVPVYLLTPAVAGDDG